MTPDEQTTDNLAHSTIVKNLTPEQRSHLDRAITDRDPPTYKGIYKRFRLAERNISFSAFYRYARKIRFNVETLHTATLAYPDGVDLHAVLPELIAVRLMEIINDPDNPPTPDAVLRLTHAHRAATQTLIALLQQQEKMAHLIPPQQPERSAPPGCPPQHEWNPHAEHPSLPPVQPQFSLPPEEPESSMLDALVEEVIRPLKNP